MSRIVLGIGITLSVASVLSIYITSVASQNQSVSTSSTSPSQVSQQPVASNISNSAASSNSTNATTTITIPQGASTQQVSQYYLPVNTTVPKDASITWTNKDIAPHTATASDGSFDTGIINVGTAGSATVKGQGDIQYHCTIHPWMHGSLQVSG